MCHGLPCDEPAPSPDEYWVVVHTTHVRLTTLMQSRLLEDPGDYRAASAQFPTKTSWTYH